MNVFVSSCALFQDVTMKIMSFSQQRLCYYEDHVKLFRLSLLFKIHWSFITLFYYAMFQRDILYVFTDFHYFFFKLYCYWNIDTVKYSVQIYEIVICWISIWKNISNKILFVEFVFLNYCSFNLLHFYVNLIFLFHLN